MLDDWLENSASAKLRKEWGSGLPIERKRIDDIRQINEESFDTRLLKIPPNAEARHYNAQGNQSRNPTQRDSVLSCNRR